MAGVILPVIPKRFLDFATLAAGGTQEVILADRVELLHWRELTLKVRLHNHTLTGTNTVAIRVWPQSWTPEDPGVAFLTAGGVVSTTLGAATPSPGLLTLTIPTVGALASGAIGAMARFTALATRTGAGTMQAALTLELSSKDA
jgi:hypothetical protein